MVTIELPPEVAAFPAGGAPISPDRPELTPQQAWRLAGLLKMLDHPTVVAETPGLLEQQQGDIHSAFQPRDGWQEWVSGTIGTVMLRINRCERIERKLRDYASYRAIEFWEDDQKLAVETLALKLGREPARTVAKLRETPAGVDWLLARWRFLERVEPPAWGDDQRALAARLVGLDPLVDPAAPGFAADRIAELTGHRERVVRADAIIRGLVEADLSDDRVPGLAQLRRYSRSLHRQLKWFVDQFHVEHPDRWDDPRRRPAIYGPAVEEYRPPNRTRFDGKKPPFVVDPDFARAPGPVADSPAATVNHQTNPADTPASSENQPTEPPLLVAPHSFGGPSFAIDPPPFVHDYANEKGRHHGRPRRAGEHSREYARRQRAARRKTNLDLIQLL